MSVGSSPRSALELLRSAPLPPPPHSNVSFAAPTAMPAAAGTWAAIQAQAAEAAAAARAQAAQGAAGGPEAEPPEPDASPRCRPPTPAVLPPTVVEFTDRVARAQDAAE